MNRRSNITQDWLTSWDIWTNHQVSRQVLYRAVKSGALTVAYRAQGSRNNTKCYYLKEEIDNWLQNPPKTDLDGRGP